MIRFIAAIDDKRGTANDHGIPWGRKLTKDLEDFRKRTMGHPMLMGYNTYVEFAHPLPNRHNLVASHQDTKLRPGFDLVTDARAYLRKAQEDIWVIGGAGLFTETLDLADELYLTRVQGDFQCTKFFPEFESAFERVSKGEPITESDIMYWFEVWRRKN